MAKKEAVRRENGRGTIEKTSGRRNPYKAKVPVDTRVDKNGKRQVIYKSPGNFPTRSEAENALPDYSRTPFELSERIKTFADLYNIWSDYYFSTLSGDRYS